MNYPQTSKWRLIHIKTRQNLKKCIIKIQYLLTHNCKIVYYQNNKYIEKKSSLNMIYRELLIGVKEYEDLNEDGLGVAISIVRNRQVRLLKR